MADYISREAVLDMAYWHGDKSDADQPYHFDPDDEDGLCCAKAEAMLCPGENDYCSHGQRKDQSADVRKMEDIPDAAKEKT